MRVQGRQYPHIFCARVRGRVKVRARVRVRVRIRARVGL